MAASLMPLQWVFNIETSLSLFSCFLTGDKLHNKSYMWSLYSNGVASLHSSVNFPIDRLTKRGKQKIEGKTLGIRLTFRKWGFISELLCDQWEPITGAVLNHTNEVILGGETLCHQVDFHRSGERNNNQYSAWKCVFEQFIHKFHKGSVVSTFNFKQAERILQNNCGIDITL